MCSNTRSFNAVRNRQQLSSVISISNRKQHRISIDRKLLLQLLELLLEKYCWNDDSGVQFLLVARPCSFILPAVSLLTCTRMRELSRGRCLITVSGLLKWARSIHEGMLCYGHGTDYTLHIHSVL